MENTKPKEILENIINVMEKTNVDEWEIDKLVVVLNYINELENENRLLTIREREEHEQISNAIEYIHNNQIVFEFSDRKGIQIWFDKFYKELLEILRGEEL